MSDTITPIKETPQPSPETKKVEKVEIGKTDEEVPFTEYKNVKNHPYLVDHFKLGDSWKDKDGGFEKEVSFIEDYFKGEIEKGNIKNDISSVKQKMDKLYKLCNIEKSERTTMQIEKLSAYIEFLKKTEDITSKHKEKDD